MVSSRRHVLLAAAIAAALPSFLVKADTDSVYSGPNNGGWNTPANWTPSAFAPNNGNGGVNYTATINTPVNVNVDQNIGITINKLTIGGTSSGVTLLNNSALVVGGGTLLNNGVLTIAAGPSNTDLIASGNLVLTGSGSLVLGASSTNRFYGSPGSSLITIDTNMSVLGGGLLGVGGAAFTNNGTITSTAGMVIQPNATGMVNNSLIQATGATMTLRGSTFSGNGTIKANDASLVRLDSGATLSGANLVTIGTGQIINSANQTDGLTNVTLTSGSTFLAENNTFTNVSGTITNNGNFTISAGASNTDLRINGNTTFTGNGVYNLSNTINSRLYAANGTDVLTLDTGATIQGIGQIGVGALSVINKGLISANNLSSSLTIAPNAGGLTNSTGTLLATSGGNLFLSGSTFNNAGGNITASGQGLNGTIPQASIVHLINSVSITGGNLNTTGNGIIQVDPNQAATLTNVTLTSGSQLIGLNNTFTNVSGTFTNLGTFTISPGASNTDLRIVGDTTLAGNGVYTLANNTLSRIYAANNIATLTLNPESTIQGTGQIGVGLMAVANHGTISANNPLSPLTMAPNATGLTNSGGVLLATNGGNLFLSGSTFNNAGGNITATGQGLNGTNPQASIVHLINSVSITGGNFNTSGIGLIQVDQNQTTTLQNVTLTAGSQFVALNNSSTNLLGIITNNGNFALSAGASNTDFRISGPVEFAGSGIFNLTNNSLNRVYAPNGIDLLTIDSTIMLQGGGQLGVGSLSLLNNGTINSNASVGLVLVPSGNVGATGFTNNSLMEATSGSTMFLQSGVFHNANGTILAADNSFVRCAINVTIEGGKLTTAGTGQILVSASQNVTLNGVTITTGSQVASENNSATFLSGTITNNGTFTVLGGANLTDLRIVGPTTFAGNGTFTLNNDINDRIFANNSVDTLTINASMTVQGAGQIGANAMALINNGTIIANQSSGMILQPNGVGVTNNLLLLATAGSTMTLRAGTFTNNGVIRADDASFVRLDVNASVIGGNLTTIGTGKIIVTASNNASLTNVTLTTGSQFVIENNSIAFLSGNFTNNGVFTQSGAANFTDLRIVGPTRFSGTGTFNLSSSPNNRIFANNNVDTLTIDAGITLQGAGQIGANAMGVINNGTIISNQSNGLILQPNAAGFINNLLLLATSGSTMSLRVGIFTNNATIKADDASFVRLDNGVTINGGNFVTAGTGQILVSASSTAILSNFTITAGSQVASENNSTTYMSGTITANGTYTLAGAANNTDLRILGPTHFTGSGAFVMGSSPNNRFFANNGVDTLTVDAGAVLRGGGQLGATGMGIVNSGTILANNSSNAMIVAPNAVGFISTGTLLADGATLAFQGNIQTLSGNITATNGGTLAFNSGAITVSTPINVNGGTAAFNGNNNSVTTITGSGTSSVGTNGSVISDRVTVDTLSSSGLHTIRQAATLSPTPSTVSTLSFSGSGRLDLTNNSLIVKNGASVGSQIRQAAHLGAWNGSPGITSSRAAAAATSSTATGLGYATGTEFATNNGQTTFQGVTFNATDTLVMYTLAGDANMDKSVTFADFLLLQNNYNQQNTSWERGDWNYDGSTTFADFLILQNNYNKVLALGNLTGGGGGGASAVPEPTSLMLLLSALALAPRRRPKHRR